MDADSGSRASSRDHLTAHDRRLRASAGRTALQGRGVRCRGRGARLTRLRLGHGARACLDDPGAGVRHRPARQRDRRRAAVITKRMSRKLDKVAEAQEMMTPKAQENGTND
eukprot:7150438-Prymnesium_polylepis.2